MLDKWKAWEYTGYMKKILSYDKTLAREMLVQSNLIEDMSMGYAHDDAEKAWKYIVKVPKLSIASILRVHELLMERINPRIAGKIRTCDVWIGGNHKKYLGENILKAQLADWMADMDLFQSGDLEKKTTEAHISFEGVHPFEDGNGRVGRILYNWHRLKVGLPIHVIHVGQEQYNYYEWFKKQNNE